MSYLDHWTGERLCFTVQQRNAGCLSCRSDSQLEELFQETIDELCEVAFGLTDTTKWASARGEPVER